MSTLCFRNSDRAVERLQIDLEANVSLDKGVRLRISVNEDPKVDLELTQTGQVSCDVEAALAPGAICKLTIEIDRTFMPSQFGFPEDNRVLGIFVRSVRCVSESQSGESYSGLRLASS